MAKKNIIIFDSLVADVRSIIEEGRQRAFATAGQVAILTYWNIGRRIVEEEQQGNARADYGKGLIPALADRLTAEYGSGYGRRNLAYYRKFYLEFSDLEILHTRVQNLNWSHIRRILSVSNPEARECISRQPQMICGVSRHLTAIFLHNIMSEDLPHSAKIRAIPAPRSESDPLEYIKNPMVAEFMGFHWDNNYSESQLEQALVDNLEKFILELGRGFAFVERQQHIITDTADFYIDLVFYNFKMKRFVIFELKTHKLTHQDIGQLDMYVRMYDDLVKGADDAPTVGVLLCTDTDSTIAIDTRFFTTTNNSMLQSI